MPHRNEEFQKNLSKIWKMTQEQLNKIAQDASVLAKKSEIYLRDISDKGKIEAEILIAKAKREKLYYDLGKIVACHGRAAKEKKIALLKKELSSLNKDIKKNERSLA